MSLITSWRDRHSGQGDGVPRSPGIMSPVGAPLRIPTTIRCGLPDRVRAYANCTRPPIPHLHPKPRHLLENRETKPRGVLTCRHDHLGLHSTQPQERP